MALQHSTMPHYIERVGEVVYAPPGVATGVRMYAFLLRADPKRQQQMYDRYLNGPCGGVVEYEPAGPLVVLNFTTLNHVGALTPPVLQRGYFLENEVAIWSLGYDSQQERYSTFVPYMFVDQGSAMAMGREVYGFPKQLGVVSMPGPDERPDEFVLETPGVAKWGENEQFTQQTLITISQTAAAAPMYRHDFASQAHLVAELASLIAQDKGVAGVMGGGDAAATIDHAAHAAELLASETLPMVFFKQIRDARTLYACFQGIHAADFVVTGSRGAGHLPGRYRIDIADLANEPIRRDLGLPDGPLTPVGAFWVDFDFTLSVGDEIWRAAVPPTVVTRTAETNR